MITTGSKLFFGFSFVAAAATLIYAMTSGTPGDMIGIWILVSFGLVALFLGGTVALFRDAEPSKGQLELLLAADAEGKGRRPMAPTAWPMLGAFGLAVTAFGMVLDKWLFLLGIIVAVIALVEWTVQGWADRASDDPTFNARLRGQIMRPFEFPIFGAVIGAFVITGFSRVLLNASEHGAVVIFAIIAAVVFGAAIVVALVPNAGRVLLPVFLVLGGIGVIVGGIAAASDGYRTFERKEGEEKQATKFISNKSNVVAVVRLEGTSLVVGAPKGRLVVPKATTLNILFRNESSEREALVIAGADHEPIAETDLIDEGRATILTFRLDTPGEYELATEGGPSKASSIITVL
jgi:hypothetical protein